MTRFKKIYYWNMSRGLIAKGFNHETEIKLLSEELLEFISTPVENTRWWHKLMPQRYKVPTEHEMIDALNDIIVVATGAIYKMGYDADKTLDETIKEIESRRGKINLKTGKFEKDLSPEAKELWCKANYDKCKL